MNILRAPTDTERATLGSLILDKDAAALGFRVLEPDHFGLPSHGSLYSLMRELYATAGVIDIPMLAGRLEIAGSEFGKDYLERLCNTVPTPKYMPQYIQELDLARFRRRIVTAHEDAIKALESGEDDKARDLIKWAIERSYIPESDTVEQQTDQALETIETEIRGGIVAAPTGFAALDSKLNGLRGGRVYTLYAHTGIGKSWFALQMALAAGRSGHKVYWFPKEMSALEMNIRLLALIAEVPTEPAKLRKSTNKQREALREAAEIRKEIPIVFDSRKSSLQEMIRTASALKGQVRLYVIDPIQMVTVDGTKEVYDEIRILMREFKAMALDTDSSVLLVSHINREASNNWDPSPHTMKGGSAIEQDSDVLMALARKPILEQPDSIVPAQLTIHKNRGGYPGRISLSWNGLIGRYEESESLVAH